MDQGERESVCVYVKSNRPHRKKGEREAKRKKKEKEKKKKG